MQSLTAATGAAMGLAPGGFTIGALDAYLDEHEPWEEPERHAHFLGEYVRYSEFARAHFGYSAKPAEEKAAAAGALLAATGA